MAHTNEVFKAALYWIIILVFGALIMLALLSIQASANDNVKTFRKDVEATFFMEHEVNKYVRIRHYTVTSDLCYADPQKIVDDGMSFAGKGVGPNPKNTIPSLYLLFVKGGNAKEGYPYLEAWFIEGGKICLRSISNRIDGLPA